MSRTVLIEVILLLIISLISIIEALRLIIQRDPQILYDEVGPGFYVLFLGIVLMSTAVVHLTVNYRKNIGMEKVAINKQMRMRVIGMLVALAIYTCLLDIAGYLVSSATFFLLVFRIIGVKYWITNVILTFVLTALYYIVFVKYCNIIFPRGIFF
jgi:hypothetical protein